MLISEVKKLKNILQAIMKILVRKRKRLITCLLFCCFCFFCCFLLYNQEYKSKYMKVTTNSDNTELRTSREVTHVNWEKDYKNYFKSLAKNYVKHITRNNSIYTNIYSAENVANRWIERLNVCTWSYPPFKYPFWDNNMGKKFIKIVEILNNHNIKYLLVSGALLGAYRHGGPIPCDGDMDVVFPVWLNNLTTCLDGSVPILHGYEKNDTKMLTLCNKTRAVYVAENKKWLIEHVPEFESINPATFGGWRVNFIDLGVDWVVSILDQSIIHDGPLCRCRFGSIYSVCLENTQRLLNRKYGSKFMVPPRNKEICIKSGKTKPSSEVTF